MKSYMNPEKSRGKGIIINLDRIPHEEWDRIFNATQDGTPIYKIATTLKIKSVDIIKKIREHGEVMIDTRLGEYLPAIDECMEMIELYDER